MWRLCGPQCDRFDANGVIFKTPGQPAARGANGHRGRCGVWPEKLRGLAPGEGVLVIDAQARNRFRSCCGSRPSIPKGGFKTRAIRIVVEKTRRAIALAHAKGVARRVNRVFAECGERIIFDQHRADRDWQGDWRRPIRPGRAGHLRCRGIKTWRAGTIARHSQRNIRGLVCRNCWQYPAKAVGTIASLLTSHCAAIGRFGQNASWQAQTNSSALRNRRSIPQFERDLPRASNREPNWIL